MGKVKGQQKRTFYAADEDIEKSQKGKKLKRNGKKPLAQFEESSMSSSEGESAQISGKMALSNDHFEAFENLTEKESKKILKQAKDQQLELQDEERSTILNSIFNASENVVPYQDKDNASTSEDEDIEETEEWITEEDRHLFAKWTASNSEGSGKSLSELILSKLSESTMTDTCVPQEDLIVPQNESNLNPKIIEVYTKLGELLGRYKSGKLPKAFKVLPVLKNWQTILPLTKPESWTPHAVYQGTRLFSSILNPAMTQRYYSAILLPHLQNDLKEHKKLNYHLYMALKKALYKPSAFFKGILLPLCARDATMGETTLREAAIIASVLGKSSIPVLHASACLLKLTELKSGSPGVISIIIRTLLDKKFTLPFRVIDALVDYFSAFSQEEKSLYVLWHQSLLVFIERYKMELTKSQQASILDLIKVKHHPIISNLIRKELEISVSREDTMQS